MDALRRIEIVILTLALLVGSAGAANNISECQNNGAACTLAAGTTIGGAAPLSTAYVTIGFNSGALTTIPTSISMQTMFTPKALTLDGCTLSASVATTCTVGVAFEIRDCGVTANACASPVTMCSGTTGTGTTRGVAGTLGTTTVATGHYLDWEITTGSCAAWNGGGVAVLH